MKIRLNCEKGDLTPDALNKGTGKVITTNHTWLTLKTLTFQKEWFDLIATLFEAKKLAKVIKNKTRLQNFFSA